MQKTVQELKLHDHSCLVFENRVEFFHCLIPFINDGIKNNEKCFIVLDDIIKEEVLKSFKLLFKDQINPFIEMKNGKIVFEEFKNVYLGDNKFNCKTNAEYYLKCLTKAISEGYSGLRIFAEISSSAKNILDDFFYWERYADKLFPDVNFIAVCAYNKKYLNNGDYKRVMDMHKIKIDSLKTRL